MKLPHLNGNGFKKKLQTSCYLPRETYQEEAKVGNRKIIIHNYLGVEQKVGKSEF